jgi:hypothetical protein
VIRTRACRRRPKRTNGIKDSPSNSLTSRADEAAPWH